MPQWDHHQGQGQQHTGDEGRGAARRQHVRQRQLLTGQEVLDEAAQHNKEVIIVGVATAAQEPRPTVATKTFYERLDHHVDRLPADFRRHMQAGQDFLREFLHHNNAIGPSQDNYSYVFAVKGGGPVAADQWKASPVWQMVSLEEGSAFYNQVLKKQLQDNVANAIKRKLSNSKKNQKKKQKIVHMTDTAEQEEECGDTELAPLLDELDIENLETVVFEPERLHRPTHATFQRRIKQATDVTAFEEIFNDLDFIMVLVNRAQERHGNRWEWCVKWAKARRDGLEWADIYEKDRKTVLKLLEYLWRRFHREIDDPVDFCTITKLDICKEFGANKIERILNIFLPMDKANAYYKMTPDQSDNSPPGLAWYSKVHSTAELEARKVQPNPSGKGPLNHRYVRLVNLANGYLDAKKLPRIGTYFMRFMDPEMPPPLIHRVAIQQL